MLTTITNILNSTIISKLGDWVIEVYKIVAGKKEKDKESNPSVVVNIIQNTQPSTPLNQQATPSSGVVLPPPPNNNIPSGDEPPSSIIIPSSSAKEDEPEFGSDEYVTQLLKAVYKNKRADDSFELGLGNTDEINNKGNENG
jgi:hypothetical protein